MPEPTLKIATGLAMPLDAVTSTFGILGVRGSGKTTTAAVLVEELLGNQIPCAIVDPTGAHWGLRSSANGKQAGYPVTIFGGEHADIPLEPGSGEMIANVLVAERIPAILDLSLLRKTQMSAWVADFLETLYRRNRLALHLVIDEAQLFAPQRTFAGSERALGAVEDVALRGRIRGLGLSLIAQRAASINKSVLTQMETLILMRTVGRPDIAAIDEWIANHADPEQGRRVKSELAALPTGTAWVWSPHFLDVLQRVQIRRRTTFDSSSTPKAGQARIAPAKWASIDVAALGERIQAAVETAKASDPKALRLRVAQLERELAAAHASTSNGPAGADQLAQLRRALADKDAALEAARGELIKERGIQQRVRRSAKAKLADLNALLEPLHNGSVDADSGSEEGTARLQPPAEIPSPKRQTPPRPSPPRSEAPPQAADVSGIAFRTGARRMVESLGRMAPLRLTKSQWGTVARLKTSGGTWSTYLSEIRRAGLLDETSAGYTLSDAGFEYLGGRPDPMTAKELQDHYRSILRSGAVKMLDALMAAYPGGLTRDELGAAAEIATSGGTFSTYLSDLVRNGLADRDGGLIAATSILMHGAGT